MSRRMAVIFGITLLLAVYSVSSVRTPRDAVADVTKHPYVQSVLSVLPPATKAEVLKIGTDASLSPEQKLEKLHAVISALPQAVRDRIPIPPALKKLPAPIQNKIVTIVKNGGLSLAQKRAQLDAIYDSLTPQQKALVPLWTELRKKLGL